MARDSTPFVRPAILRLLAAAPEVVALVPADRHYPGQRPPKPPWPFIAYGQPITVPFQASCLDGSTVSPAIHAYAATTGEGDDTVPGEDMAQAIIRVVVEVLGGEDGAEVPLIDAPYPATAHIQWTGSQCVQDGSDANAFHAWATFDITVSS